MPNWNQVVSEIENFTQNIRDLPVSPQLTLGELRAKLERHFTFEKPLQLEPLTDEVIRLLRQGSVHVTHPRYFGLFNPSVREAGIVADTLAALYNPQLAAWSHAPAANEIERHTLRFLGRMLGLDERKLFANFTSGGAEANLTAVLAALAQQFPETAEAGLANLPTRPAIYLTEESHHSFAKIARMAGLGTRSLRKIAVNSTFVMDPMALKDQIETDLSSGWTPLMIVGTAGTTGAGAIDPLLALASVSQAFGAWFHVDAAWGGSAVLSSKLRASLAGIDQADSITWDAHKWLSVPMGAGMFFCQHPEAVRRAFAITTTYMPGGAGEENADPYASTVQWSRRAIGLKVFMSLAELGITGYEKLIDHQAAMGGYLRKCLLKKGWTIVNETPLPVVCFTHADIRSGLLLTSDLLQKIYQRGRIWISDVVLGGRERVLRACITSYKTQKADIDCLIEEINVARQS